ncbi:putative MFS transporter [Pseudoneurospora amorphoporcata]|uniref:MFS transporter n=1 Tax=Pseudoneurospora amorphoporcata TaxID=241081 RepID=A0AAN6NJR0_9PEZI|nr:putative MFS transporter [Pseudoneurospora amorphoporcata]
MARDKATDFLANHAEGGTSFSTEEEKAVLRRIDLCVLPLLLWAYFFQQLDKSSLNYVSIFGITDDAHLVGKQYSWLGSILYLAQLFWQPAAAFILVKLLTGKIILLFCGLLTGVYSVAVLIFMPDSPMEAKYLREREKVIAVERLRAYQMGVASRTWRWDHVLETLLDLKTWCWFIAIIAISQVITSGGIGNFGNLIVKSFGYSSFETILFNIPFGVIQVVAVVGTGWLATRFQRKGLVIAGVSVLPMIGTILMLTVSREHKGVLLFGYYLVSCMAAITPLIYAWQAQNTGGDTKKKCTKAVEVERSLEEDNALQDMTDLRNEDFIFVY